MTSVRSIVKRRSHAVERTLPLVLVRLVLVVTFLAIVVLATFPLIRLTRTVASLSKENRALQMQIFELEQQLRQLKAEQILLMSSREVIVPAPNEQ